MSHTPPPTPAGWYPDHTMADTLRYWDGTAWTDHVAPASNQSSAPAAAGSTQVCPYCRNAMAEGATRCAACSGELKWCPKCQGLVGVTTNSKFVGMARGGTKTQYRCGQCRRVLEGPRW